MNKVVLIGCGNVGMAYSYALVNQKVYVDELVLIDINKDKCEGEAMDLNHCMAYSPSKIKVRVGDYSDCSDAKIIVIAAGANQAVGESRMDLIHKNSNIFKSIISEVMKNNFKGIFIVATNPLDVMTYITLKLSGLDAGRVIGSGTTLDTSRLRYMLSLETGVNPKNIEAYVIGEHGDSEFVPWSNVNIAYGIGMCLVKITNAIIEDKNSILPVSSWDKNNNICISTPAIVGKDGVKDKIFVPLNQEETEKLKNSIKTIKDAINSLDL